MPLSRHLVFWSLSLVIGWGSGCDSPTDRFPPNELFARVVVHPIGGEAERASADVGRLVESLFGTPDSPLVPDRLLAAGDGEPLIDPQRLTRAAGPVSSDREGMNFGIYRAQCVVCHGLSGDGAGPAAALQNPYPRDFRSGVFKYKSTTRGSKPTRDDLRRLLVHGIPGTGMPSFARQPAEDREALVDYLIYLSIRGEVERRLLAWSVAELGYGEADGPTSEADSLVLLDSGRLASDELAEQVDEILGRVVDSWLRPEPVAVPTPPTWDVSELASAAARGRELFHGPLANCASCHGTDGDGSAVTLDFDDWTKEFTTRLGVAPSDPIVRDFRRAGALRPRPISPRKLSWGNFRGGSEPDSLYRLLTVGIAGTPMPGLLVTAEPGGVGVTPDQVWDLVAYLQSLSPDAPDPTPLAAE